MISRGYSRKSASQSSVISQSAKEHKQGGIKNATPKEQEQGGGSSAESPLEKQEQGDNLPAKPSVEKLEQGKPYPGESSPSDKVVKSSKDSIMISKPASTLQLIKRRMDKPPAQVPCRYFNAGYCARGEACAYKHDSEKLRLQKFKLKTVLKSSVEDAQLQGISQGDHLLKKEYMVSGRSKEALATWRAEYWEKKTAEARAYQSQIAREAEKEPTEKNKVYMDVKRLQNKVDPAGSSARKLEGAKNLRKSIFIKSDAEDPGVPIPSEGECCPICQDDPKSITIFGIMSRCNHVFCYECIVGWRGSSSVNKTCPICRVKSPFIVKSSVYPYNPSGKVVDDDNISAECSKEPNKPIIERSRSISSNEVSSTTQVKDKVETANKSNTSVAVNEMGNPRLPPVSGNEHAVHSNLANESNNSNDLYPDDQQNHHHSVKNSGSGPRNVQFPNSEHIKRKRSRRKQPGPAADPNPAKAVILNNYLKKMKTIPCKYFCDPKNAKIVILSPGCKDSQSSLWSDVSVRENRNIDVGGVDTKKRKIPFCKFGNKCHYAHPHPEKPDEEYKYSKWEKRVLGLGWRGNRENGEDDFEAFPDDLDLQELMIAFAHIL